MQTMQVQPGRCLGCFVVAPTKDSAKSSMLSPKTAAVANASNPEGSPSLDALLSALRRLLDSEKCKSKAMLHELIGIEIYIILEIDKST